MAKIKLYFAETQSNNSGAAKGTAENPYTEAEYEAMLNNGTWPGGYVQNLGYCMKEIVISSSDPDSWPIDSDDFDSWDSDDSWPSDDFDSWDSSSEPWEDSEDDGSAPSPGTSGSGNNNNSGNQGGSNSGGHGSSTGYSISKAVSYLESHAYPNYINGVCGNCAYAIRMALKAGGVSTVGHPESACEYDSFLPKLGSIWWTG